METEKHDTVNIVSLVSIFEEGDERRREIFARITRRMERKKDGTSKGGPGVK